MISRVFIIAAGLAGAAGVAAAAASAHAGGGNLATASTMLLVHAPAFLAIGLTGVDRARSVDYAGIVLLAGVALFCGDLATRHYVGTRLFPYAAPTGGVLMIAGWLAVSLQVPFRRR